MFNGADNVIMQPWEFGSGVLRLRIANDIAIVDHSLKLIEEARQGMVKEGLKITPDGKASLAVAGPSLVGLAFAPGRSVILATTGGVHHLSWNIQGFSPLSD